MKRWPDRRWLGHAANSEMVDRHYSQITPDMVDGGVDALNRAARNPGSPERPGPYLQGPRLLPAIFEDVRREAASNPGNDEEKTMPSQQEVSDA